MTQKMSTDNDTSRTRFLSSRTLSIAIFLLIAAALVPKLSSYLEDFGFTWPLTASNDGVDYTLRINNFTPNQYQAAPYVSNGYLGQALPAEGVGYWVFQNEDGTPALNGWPLDQDRATFGTISGFWNLQERVTHPILWENVARGGESVIAGIPDWTALTVSTSTGETYQPGVSPHTVVDYTQSQSLTDGIVTTNVTWQPASVSTPIQLNFTVLTHQNRPTLGLVRLDLTLDGPISVKIRDIIDGRGAVRSEFHEKGFEQKSRIWTSVKPLGVGETTAYIVSQVQFLGLSPEETDLLVASRKDATGDKEHVSVDASTISQSWDLTLAEDQRRTISIIKHVGIVSSDAFPNQTMAIAVDTVNSSLGESWEDLIQEHSNSWAAVWDDADIVVPGDAEVQTTVRGAMFHLLSNSIPDKETIPKGMTQNSISVGGLSSDSYAGLVFWDSDVWMYPSLLALHPDRAKPILNYRQRLLPQALENSQLYNRPGALYPWTSGRYGNCTGTGICALYQYHLNTDIAMSHWDYYLHSGDVEWLKDHAWPILKSVADMFAEYVVLNETTGRYDTLVLGEPDEFAYYINNGAFTNAGIKLLLGEWAPTAAKLIGQEESISANWSAIAKGLTIPYDDKEKIILEYDGMDGTVIIKQASVALLSYPLGWKIEDGQALNDLAFYARTTTPDGPAMTWAIYAIAALHLHPTGCAGYTYLLQASQPYLRDPFQQFSEQRTDTWSWSDGSSSWSILEEYFGTEGTTAAFPFLTGYGGYLQIFTHGFTGMRAESDALVIDPVMVPQLPEGIKVRGIKYRGAALDFDIGLQHTTISRRKASREDGHVVLRHFDKHFTLLPGQKIKLDTRRPDLTSTSVLGNIAQCKPVRSESSGAAAAWVAGRHPPLTADAASIVISLGETRSVSSVLVNWAAVPAESFSVHGKLGDEWMEMLRVEDIKISSPYDPEKVKKVAVPKGNTTEARLEKKWECREVKFTIQGTQGPDKASGATVAEISLV
uniref:alpha,alpha-trehalase n=1 Tax=Bionectria ochroleuca TaxID=29856 RepID=A0A0B7K532_BIOOC